MQERRVYYYDDDRIRMLASLARYEYALRFVQGKKVLDVGCGARRGPRSLARCAKSVVGVDITPQALLHCQRRWPQKNVSYAAADALHLPFCDESFEVITAFEVIEHLEEYGDFVRELSRVLKKGGCLILSTPNRLLASPDGVLSNPDHKREFTFDELKEFLAGFFANLRFSGQRYPIAVKRIQASQKESYSFTQKVPQGFRRLLPRGFKDTLFRVLSRFWSLFRYAADEGGLKIVDFSVDQGLSLDEALFFVAVAEKI